MAADAVHPIGRRDFFECSLCALAGTPAALSVLAFLSGCASLVTRAVVPENGTVRLALVHYPELAVAGGSLKVLPAGSVDPIYVLALGDGGYAALSPICTHLGCTVDIQGARLVCPCHGSTYDRDGRVLQGPAERSLARYATELTADGVLIIDLGSRA